MNPEPAPTQPVVEPSPRIRFAKREIVKILTALEMVNGSDLDLGIRVMQLEDDLAGAREDARRWRRSCESLQKILDECVTSAAEEQVEILDKAVRSWVGRA